jgi:hypothetical protein
MKMRQVNIHAQLSDEVVLIYPTVLDLTQTSLTFDATTGTKTEVLTPQNPTKNYDN